MFTVYVIKSRTSGKIYIGQTSNLERRLLQHNNPGFNKGSYTKLQGTNWEVLYKDSHNTRKEALKRERFLKSHLGRDWLRQNLGL